MTEVHSSHAHTLTLQRVNVNFVHERVQMLSVVPSVVKCSKYQMTNFPIYKLSAHVHTCTMVANLHKYVAN